MIIVAEDTEFRFFKGILADHSPIFKEMFSDSSYEARFASDAATCSAINLTDKADEVRHLLRICIPRSRA